MAAELFCGTCKWWAQISLPVVNVNKPLYPSVRWDFVVDELNQVNGGLSSAFLSCPTPLLLGSSKETSCTPTPTLQK